MSLLLITTGGTIDSHRDTKQQIIAPLRHTIVPETMQKLWLPYDEHIALCLKDARDLDENDLNKLLDIIQTTDHNQIFITHGYQTLANTIKRLEQKRKKDKKRKSIVVVDSLTPLSEPDSDAPDQLIAAHQLLTTNHTPHTTIIRKKQPITVDELQALQYAGEVSSEWCL